MGGFRPFPAANVWNQDISGAPVDPNSAAYIASIGAQSTAHASFGTTWNGAPNGIIYGVVSGSQKRVPVSFLWSGESDPGPYPIPAETALIEGGPNGTLDRHVIIIDRDNLKLYELYRAFLNADGSWRADSGAVFDLVNGTDRPDGWTSADAAGLPIFPGLVRYDEVMVRGEINHALRFTAALTQAAHVYPARHHASNSSDPSLPPMGARVRMKTSYDCSWASRPVQVICRALKKYGMFLADNGANWDICGAPHPGWNDDELHDLTRVPGSAFEVVKLPVLQR